MVAIKVLRRDLARNVRADVALLQTLALPLGAAFPGIDAGAVIREVRERALAELDLEGEAELQRRVHRALGEQAGFHVPAPLSRLSHPAVLVTPWIDGIPLAEAPECDRACALLVRLVLGGVRDGLAHPGPNPADVLVRADGSVALLDWAGATPVPPQRAAATASVLEALAADDADGFEAALCAIGVLRPGGGRVAFEVARHALGDLVIPGMHRLDVAAVAAMSERLREVRPQLRTLLGAIVPQAGDLWPLRGAAQLFGTVARVGATADWLGLATAALRDGWRE
jgi:predicted unusual protein kinase regulating ubiquinone biosynthesis (AarF/ABC1/UbiB family)